MCLKGPTISGAPSLIKREGSPSRPVALFGLKLLYFNTLASGTEGKARFERTPSLE